MKYAADFLCVLGDFCITAFMSVCSYEYDGIRDSLCA